MNQKDYKNIARIINKHYKGITSTYRLRTLSNKLADYFERENNLMIKYNIEGFDRQQFSKDCGVKC